MILHDENEGGLWRVIKEDPALISISRPYLRSNLSQYMRKLTFRSEKGASQTI